MVPDGASPRWLVPSFYISYSRLFLTAMPMLFYCATETNLSTIKETGLRPPDSTRFYSTLEAAQAACADAILVVDQAVLAEDANSVETVPPSAICNLVPYLPPQSVVAGGGYVVHLEEGVVELLLIFRRGVWDLPKGKQDAGETIEACALREVREEIGIETLRSLGELGTTLHGYAEDGKYMVKTTHWYLMQTPERDFTPEAREGIEAVEWIAWDEAEARIGFESLRQHMQQARPLVMDALSV